MKTVKVYTEIEVTVAVSDEFCSMFSKGQHFLTGFAADDMAMVVQRHLQDTGARVTQPATVHIKVS